MRPNIHYQPGEVKPMSGLLVKTRDGRYTLSRERFKEVETGVTERAAKEASSLGLWSMDFRDLDSAMSALALWALDAVDDQLKADAGIDINTLDLSQAKRLFYSYSIAVFQAQRDGVQ